MKNMLFESLIEKLKNLLYVKVICLEQEEFSFFNLHISFEEQYKKDFLQFVDAYIVETEGILYTKRISKNKYFIKYDDGFMFYLVLNKGNIHVVNEFRVLLNREEKEVLLQRITPELIGGAINDITYQLDKFNKFFSENDKVNAISVLSDTYKLLLKLLNCLHNPEKRFLNYRDCMKNLPEMEKAYCLKIEKRLKIDTLQECSKLISVLLDEHVSNITINIAFHVNIDYYMHVKEKIFS